MKKILLILFIVNIVIACKFQDNRIDKKISVTGPIQLHPDNQHYFLFKGKPLAIISSGEHYGAVINLDFNYRNYLETLSSDGMNYTRIFTGTYYEAGGEYFGIQHNTLGPVKERIITPWAIVDPNSKKQAKYNLANWNKAYFKRLKNFMKVASQHNIIVEVTLFSSYYGDKQWKLNPLNPTNNINISQEISYAETQTIKDTLLFKFQELYVRKMVKELNEYDNFFFEIQNEPWSDHLDTTQNNGNKESLSINDSTLNANFASEESLLWQKKIASIIIDEEKGLAKKHLIAQNYADLKNYYRMQSLVSLRQEQRNFLPHSNLTNPIKDDKISIILFHYAGPETLEWSYHYNKVIGFDESGFAGTEDITYRRQAWRFMLSGGGLFNNLDYSFFVGHEDGLGKNKAPGGGSRTLRRQLKVLSDFLHSFDLAKLQPNSSCVTNSPRLIPFILSNEDNAYAIFLEAIETKESILSIKTDNGKYMVQTLNTITGLFSDPVIIESVNGILNIEIDIPEGELAIIIKKQFLQ